MPEGKYENNIRKNDRDRITPRSSMPRFLWAYINDVRHSHVSLGKCRHRPAISSLLILRQRSPRDDATPRFRQIITFSLPREEQRAFSAPRQPP